MNEATVWKGERLGQIGLENRLPSIALVQSVRRFASSDSGMRSLMAAEDRPARTFLSSSGSSIVVEDRSGIRRLNPRLAFRRARWCSVLRPQVRFLDFSISSPVAEALFETRRGLHSWNERLHHYGQGSLLVLSLRCTCSSSSSQNQAQVFLGGPPLVKMACVLFAPPPHATDAETHRTSEISTAEELGGADMHSRISGPSPPLRSQFQI